MARTNAIKLKVNHDTKRLLIGRTGVGEDYEDVWITFYRAAHCPKGVEKSLSYEGPHDGAPRVAVTAMEIGTRIIELDHITAVTKIARGALPIWETYFGETPMSEDKKTSTSTNREDKPEEESKSGNVAKSSKRMNDGLSEPDEDPAVGIDSGHSGSEKKAASTSARKEASGVPGALSQGSNLSVTNLCSTNESPPDTVEAAQPLQKLDFKSVKEKFDQPKGQMTEEELQVIAKARQDKDGLKSMPPTSVIAEVRDDWRLRTCGLSSARHMWKGPKWTDYIRQASFAEKGTTKEEDLSPAAFRAQIIKEVLENMAVFRAESEEFLEEWA